MSGFKSVCLWIFFVLISFCLANAANDSSYDFDALISEFKNLKESSDYCIEHYENGVCKALRFCDGQQSKSKKDLCSLFKPLKPDIENDNSNPSKRPSSGAVWGYGVLCVTLISLTSVIGVSFVPLMSKSFYNNLLSSLIGLAVGSLSGSAIFHLIPSAFSLSEVDFYPHHSYLSISFVVWIGVYLFFIIERFLKVFMEYKSRREVIDHNVGLEPQLDTVAYFFPLKNLGNSFLSHGHSHCHQDPSLMSPDAPSVVIISNNSCPSLEDEECKQPLNRTTDQESQKSGCIVSNIPSKELYEQSKQAMRASFGHLERPNNPDARPTVEKVLQLESQARGSKVATVAWMIIFGDGVHNFIDGLSIGAAFSESILTGISVSVAVLCEEFPHELGDFAVLLNAGMTVRQAMVYNFLSACTCYLGLFLGILLGEMEMGNQYIFAAAGGMFLYIALVDMVPELNSTMDQKAKVSVKDALFVFMLQNVGIILGIVSLFVLARFQDEIQIEF